MLHMIIAVALDLGTTTIKAGLLSQDGTLSNIVTRPAPTITADGGRYESDAVHYAEIADAVLNECLARTEHGGAGALPTERMGRCVAAGNPSAYPLRVRYRRSRQIAGGSAMRPLPHQSAPPHRVAGAPLGLCSQRSSFLIWERSGGKPVTPFVSWQDDRGAESCFALHEKKDVIRKLTGLPLTPYYLAPKLRVLLRENPLWREKLSSGEWLLGTLDTFLIWRWTDGTHYLTDASMAARTLLMDIRHQQWSGTLCDLFEVPQPALPEIVPSSGMRLHLKNGLVLQASMGDQSAALVASIATGQPEALVNLGTGGFVVCYLPEGRTVPEGYLHTLVWQDERRKVYAASEGTLNSIAAALASCPVDECRVEELASDDIYCLAEPSGLGAPYFRSDLGITFSEPVDHLPAQRIALLLQEGIIFRVAKILEDFRNEFGIERVYLSGGLSNLPCLQQGIAQCMPFDTYRLTQTDASLSGAAQLAAGISFAGARVAEKVKVSHPASDLPEKFIRWKKWLDGLLRSKPFKPG